MRLPWPFGRRTPPEGPSPVMPEGPAASEPAAAAPANAAVAPPTGAWATLPPIQRTVEAPPVVAPAAPFLAAVPGHRPLPPIVGQLGHDTGPGAPPGLVVARSSTVPSLTSQAAMPTRPMPRPPGDAADHGSALDSGAGPGAEHAPAAATVPVRQLASVPPAATVMPAPRPLTLAANPVPVARRSSGPAHAPAASVQASRSAPASTSLTPATGPAAGGPLPPLHGTAPARVRSRWSETPTSADGGRPAGLGAPLNVATDGARSGSASMPAEAAPTRSAGAQPAPASVSRRAGLGLPLSFPPPTAVAQRLPDGGSRPAGTGSPLATATGPAGPASASRASAGAPGVAAGLGQPSIGSQGSQLPARSLPVLAVARHRSGEPPSPGPIAMWPSPVATPPTPGAGQASAGPTPPSALRAGAVLPTLGARPLRAATAVQREPATAGPAAGQPTARQPAQVAAKWTAGADLPATVRSVAPVTVTTPGSGPVLLQRLTDQVAEPAATIPGLGLSSEIVFPARTGATGDHAVGSHGVATAAVPGIAGIQRVAAAGIPSWAPQMTSPGNRPEHASSHSSTPARGLLALARPQVGTTQAAVARLAASAPSPAATPSVQAIATQGPADVGGVTATPMVQRVDGAAPAAPSEQGRSESELDELARALFGRIRTHLRTEVIHEREAKGLTFDAF